MKRWNRQNEVLADAAERASVAAEWLGGRGYPLADLNEAWTLVMGGQFHDILPGTSIPKAYEYSWNDETIALNRFAAVLTGATGAVGRALDTRAAGTPVIVYNPLNIAREDVVEALVPFPGRAPAAVRVMGPDGREVPAQLGEGGRVTFLAKVPSVGFAVYDVQSADGVPAAGARKAAPPAKGAAPALSVTESSLENARYRVKIDQNGDIASLFDKLLKRELLSSPMRLAIKTDKPVQWPAWNMDWTDQQKPPRAYVQGPATVKIVERGPARVALEVTRQGEGSSFVQTIRLSAGDAGNRLELANAIDWKASEANLKATFPLTAGNPTATYNWDIGTIERPTNEPNKYEVPTHQWIDLTDKSGAFGVTVLTDAKYGSDKPDDNTVRLTLVRTPGISKGWEEYDDQATQDWGRHEFVYGVAAHAGDWRQGQTDWQAWRLNTPLAAFTSGKHDGALGKRFSLMTVSAGRVRALAVKKAEQGDEVVVRLVELDGKPAPGVRVAFATPLLSAREVNGAEEAVGAVSITKGELVADFSPYQVRSFAVKLGGAASRLPAPPSQPVTLGYDERVASRDGSVSGGRMDPEGHSYAAELMPTEIVFDGVRFTLAGAESANALTARGQTIALPEGKFSRLYLLAAADGDQRAAFRVGDQATDLTIQDWTGYIGQWDNRLWVTTRQPAPAKAGAGPLAPGTMPEMETVSKYAGLVPGFVKPAPIAWFASHRHTVDGSNEPYAYAYIFAYALDLPAGARTLTLPNNEKIKIFAAAVAEDPGGVRPAVPLFDNLTKGAGLR
jgi:alpha-mannosidase